MFGAWLSNGGIDGKVTNNPAWDSVFHLRFSEAWVAGVTHLTNSIFYDSDEHRGWR
jgi:hypothetical protein